MNVAEVQERLRPILEKIKGDKVLRDSARKLRPFLDKALRKPHRYLGRTCSKFNQLPPEAEEIVTQMVAYCENKYS